jgi:hypothetical protein
MKAWLKIFVHGSSLEYPLFPVKVDSGIKLWNYLLVPVVPKLHNVGDAMKVASFKNFVEGGILLLPHIIKVDSLHRDFQNPRLQSLILTWNPHIQSLILIRSGRCGITWKRGWIILRRVPWPLYKRLGVSSRSLARTGGTGRLTVLASPLMTWMLHDLGKKEQEMDEIKWRVLGIKCEYPMKKSWVVGSWYSDTVLKDRICPALSEHVPLETGYVQSG